MLVDIILLVVVLMVAVLIYLDVRKRSESPGEEAAGQGHAEPEVIGPRRIGAVAAGRGVGQRPPDLTAEPAMDRQSAATTVAAPPKSRHALQNWSVRSRLLLLVCIPTVTALVLGGLRIASSLQSAAMVHGTGAAHDRAVTSVVLESLVILLVLALVVVATALVGRSMVRPLRRLQAGALDVAARRLPTAVQQISETGEAPPDPEPIDVGSTDEIGAVARAFDQVHREALRLAANEAALRGNVNAIFVNLSRRSQSLVQRQIRLIDDLEQGEQDPERLSSLFQMDHLATRMRRNSENLLVLAGHEEARRWNEPLALVDVLRASLSEVEHYERVALDVQPGIVVRGQVVSDVVHLTAELVENATSFSAVETPVTIAGRLLSSGGALLEITDQGVGMDAEEMAHANWRLDNPPVVDVAISRRMGLFVVARLAGRHGIRVRLRSADPVGLIALVWLPDEAIMRQAPDAPLTLRDPGRAVPEAALTVEPGAADALGLVKFPARYAPLRVDAGTTNTDLETVTPGPESEAIPVVTKSQSAEPGPGADERDGIIAVRVEDSAAPENRLPIFEAVESDWFRRGGQAVERFARSGDGWTSPADHGWRAAEVVYAPSSGGITSAGLPRRVPQANLVPGTAAAASPVGAYTPPAARSAAATRDRFASFQRGVRHGRAVVSGEGADDGEDETSDEA
jgi:signal transduction histidine kinase